MLTALYVKTAYLRQHIPRNRPHGYHHLHGGFIRYAILGPMDDNMVKIARVSDFDHVRMRSYKLLARPVGVFKELDGSFRAMEVGCKHELANLLEGRMEGSVVTCPWHGWKYDLRTGECLLGAKTCLRPHALEVRDGAIYVSLRPVDVDAPQSGEW
jgi:nitrite reductase (NADH) small subunit